MRQALLSEQMEGRPLGGMMQGETAYAVPWAMQADTDRRLWLDLWHPAHQHPGGTASMRVERRADGYHVWTVDWFSYRLSGGDRRESEVPVAQVHEGTAR
jgi:hypothetical protein